MLRKLRNNKSGAALIVVLVFLLVAIRAFENEIFYDPFSDYFKSDYLNLAFPAYHPMFLFLSMALRYLLNAVFSLAIIQVLFKDWKLTEFAAVLYVAFFVVLMAAFFLLITYSDNHNNFILFYVRRFLIQPLFLLLFVPAFYYQRLKKEL